MNTSKIILKHSQCIFVSKFSGCSPSKMSWQHQHLSMIGASDFYKPLPYINDNENDVSSVSNPCTYVQQQMQFQEFL